MSTRIATWFVFVFSAVALTFVSVTIHAGHASDSLTPQILVANPDGTHRSTHTPDETWILTLDDVPEGGWITVVHASDEVLGGGGDGDAPEAYTILVRRDADERVVAGRI